MLNFLNKYLSEKKRLANRNYSINLFTKEEYLCNIKTKGYIHIKQIIDNKYNDKVLSIFNDSIQKFNFYANNPNFLNTMALQNSTAKYYIKDETTPVLTDLLSSILNIENVVFPFGGAYCINPPNAINSCKPHQDPAYVNEEKTYSLIAWIPLEDIDITNGCLHVLPKSHLWGNHKRSISMDWAFEIFSDELWKYLIPIPTKKGDIIIFDAALIHGTNLNTTSKNRLALNVPILPKNEQMITYYPFDKKKGYLYSIDYSYYLDEYLFDRPSSKFTNKGLEELNNTYTLNKFKKLLRFSLDETN